MELIDVILSKGNLNRAYKKVVANKGASGVDGVTVEELGDYIRKNKDAIVTSIRNRTYMPKPVRRVYIPKDNGKQRPLGIPTALDRTIQQAIAQPISDIYEEIFSEYSYGFRPGKSCHDAIRQALCYLNSGYEWVVDIDIEQFFDRVNHDKLIQILREQVNDSTTLIVVGIIDTGLDTKCKYFLRTNYEACSVKQDGNVSLLKSDYEDKNGHGTACASIIINECPNVEFFIINAFGESGKTNLVAIEKALKILKETSVDIINMSFAITTAPGNELSDLCLELSKNKIVVAAAANNYDGRSFPACYESVCGVRGGKIKNNKVYEIDTSKEIQCLFDNNPLMSRGSLRFEYVYDILSYLESRLNIKINYMTVSRYDMLTVGTLTKFFKESGREYFEKV